MISYRLRASCNPRCYGCGYVKGTQCCRPSGYRYGSYCPYPSPACRHAGYRSGYTLSRHGCGSPCFGASGYNCRYPIGTRKTAFGSRSTSFYSRRPL